MNSSIIQLVLVVLIPVLIIVGCVFIARKLLAWASGGGHDAHGHGGGHGHHGPTFAWYQKRSFILELPWAYMAVVAVIIGGFYVLEINQSLEHWKVFLTGAVTIWLISFVWPEGAIEDNASPNLNINAMVYALAVMIFFVVEVIFFGYILTRGWGAPTFAAVVWRWYSSPATWLGVLIIALFDRLPLGRHSVMQVTWIILGCLSQIVPIAYVMYGWENRWLIAVFGHPPHGWLDWFLPVL